MTANHEPSAAHDLTVQQADALWDAVAVPGPEQPTFPAQHERVCRAVAAILSELPAVVSSPPATDRATVYAEVAARLLADAEQGAKDGFTRIYRRSAADRVRVWADELAAEARQSCACGQDGCEYCDADEEADRG
jgi:hypothetical protein